MSRNKTSEVNEIISQTNISF